MITMKMEYKMISQEMLQSFETVIAQQLRIILIPLH